MARFSRWLGFCLVLFGATALLLGNVSSQDEDAEGFEDSEGGDMPGGDTDYGGYGDEYGGYGGGPSDGPDSHINGVLDLDDLTFDKIVDGSKHVFVEFYAPWCGHCKSFKAEYSAIAENLGSQANLLLVKVNADENKAIGGRMGVEGFPTFYFFPKGQTKGEIYEGDRSAEAIMEFLADRTGAPGTIEQFADAVKSFMSIPAERAAVIERVEKEVASLSADLAKHGEYYLKVMNSVVKRGEEHVKNEVERLKRMVSGGSLKKEKETEFKQRINILRAFEKVEL